MVAPALYLHHSKKLLFVDQFPWYFAISARRIEHLISKFSVEISLILAKKDLTGLCLKMTSYNFSYVHLTTGFFSPINSFPVHISHRLFLSFMKFSPGSSFLCSVLVAPVKNENEEVIMVIMNFEDISGINKIPLTSASVPTETSSCALPSSMSLNTPMNRWRRARSKCLSFVCEINTSVQSGCTCTQPLFVLKMNLKSGPVQILS